VCGATRTVSSNPGPTHGPTAGVQEISYLPVEDENPVRSSHLNVNHLTGETPQAQLLTVTAADA
jgi:hypothetical protein